MGAAQAIGQIAGAGLNMASVVVASGAQKTRNSYEQGAARVNQAIASEAAQTAAERGTQQEAASRMKYGALKGQQAAALGASGVSATSGSALDLLANTQAMSDYDASIIRNNAAREAWGYKQQAYQQSERRRLLRQEAADIDVQTGLGLAGSLFGSIGGAIGSSGGKSGSGGG